jgi:hypothetical protein
MTLDLRPPFCSSLHLDKTAQYTNTIHEFYSLYDDEHGIGKIVILALPLFNTPPFPITWKE